jgi:hypothetical protein
LEETTTQKEVVTQPTENLFWYNTIGSFTVLGVVSFFGYYAYKTVLQDKRMGLKNATHTKSKIKIA